MPRSVARALLFAAVAPAMIFGLTATAAAAERCREVAGRVVALDGTVEVGTGTDTAGWTRLALGTAVCVGDLVRVDEGGQGALQLASGGIVRLSPGSTVRIDQEAVGGDHPTVLRLLRGILSVFSRRPH